MRALKTGSLPPLAVRAYGKSVILSADAIRIAAIAVSLLLSSHPVNRAYSATCRLAPESDLAGVANRMAPPDYDCSAGGRIGQGDFKNEALEDGLSSAFEILENCPACRQFYGGFDPVELLKRLVKKKRFIVTKEIPEFIMMNRTSGQVRVGRPLKRFKKAYVVVTMDFTPARYEGTFLRPCIYVNGYRYLGHLGADPVVVGDRSAMRRARGTAILHELAHIVDVIPHDGRGPSSAWKSAQNQQCILRNCAPCPEKSVACVHEPEPRVAPKNGYPEAKPSARSLKRGKRP